MQYGTADRCARQRNRIEYSSRGQGACPAHFDFNLLQCGLFFLGRIFESHCPFGKFCGGSQLFSLRELVHFDDRAIDVKGIVVAIGADSLYLLDRFLNLFKGLIGRDHFKSQLF